MIHYRIKSFAWQNSCLLVYCVLQTRVLVTHSLTYLPVVDHIVVMKDGRISEQGSYQQLVANKGEFQEFLLQYLAEEEEDVEDVAGERDRWLLLWEWGPIGPFIVHKEQDQRYPLPAFVPQIWDIAVSLGPNKKKMSR